MWVGKDNVMHHRRLQSTDSSWRFGELVVHKNDALPREQQLPLRRDANFSVGFQSPPFSSSLTESHQTLQAPARAAHSICSLPSSLGSYVICVELSYAAIFSLSSQVETQSRAPPAGEGRKTFQDGGKDLGSWLIQGAMNTMRTRLRLDKGV